MFYDCTTPRNICLSLNGLLDVELEEADLSDCYPLGRADNCSIKVEFLTNLKKKQILQNCQKLKGKNISIAHDLMNTQRSEQKLLRRHLSLVKHENYQDCYIAGNKLFVNAKAYKADDLEDFPPDKFLDKPNSAPATPTTSEMKKPPAALEKPLSLAEKTPSTPKSTVNKTIVPKQNELTKPRICSVK